MSVARSSGDGARVEVITGEGWRKEVSLGRGFAFVGSQPGADIYLPSPDVGPRHLQWLPSPQQALGYRLANLSTTPLTIRGRNGAERVLAGRATAEMSDGDAVELGGFRLVYRGGALLSAKMEVRIEMAGRTLEPDRTLDGVVYIRNSGASPAVQFAVAVQGIDARFVRVGSGPMLYPGIERGVAFNITHPRSPALAAGEQTLTFVVTAPLDYMGEVATASELIVVAPWFDHRARVVALTPELADFALARTRR